MAEDYWSIDIPGLSHERATTIRDLLLPKSTHGVVLLDPSIFMVRGFDRPTVELLVKCLEAGLAAGGLSHGDRAGVASMLDDCNDWLN